MTKETVPQWITVIAYNCRVGEHRAGLWCTATADSVTATIVHGLRGIGFAHQRQSDETGGTYAHGYW